MSGLRFPLAAIVAAADQVYDAEDSAGGWRHVERWQVIVFVARRLSGASDAAIASHLAYASVAEAMIADRSVTLRLPADDGLRDRVARVIGRLIVAEAAAPLPPLPTPPAPIPLLQQVTT